MRWSPDWKQVIPNIAESVDVSPDATEFTFKLRTDEVVGRRAVHRRRHPLLV